jgi:hypothetical protein
MSIEEFIDRVCSAQTNYRYRSWYYFCFNTVYIYLVRKIQKYVEKAIRAVRFEVIGNFYYICNQFKR